ncbi:Uu.00g078230.m01.CDS01 [Anthostomella pinea]|uniref:Uu.00g078230.m01.CDS01 n=1 Tax=Anthostomella pinea TaxID=933095 RepID=A0AAI8VL74_9PEZI|nr:Uu.00g078230.m01.CDS01 [Anthostomella pinea]
MEADQPANMEVDMDDKNNPNDTKGPIIQGCEASKAMRQSFSALKKDMGGLETTSERIRKYVDAHQVFMEDINSMNERIVETQKFSLDINEKLRDALAEKRESLKVKTPPSMSFPARPFFASSEQKPVVTKKTFILEATPQTIGIVGATYNYLATQKSKLRQIYYGAHPHRSLRHYATQWHEYEKTQASLRQDKRKGKDHKKIAVGNILDGTVVHVGVSIGARLDGMLIVTCYLPNNEDTIAYVEPVSRVAYERGSLSENDIVLWMTEENYKLLFELNLGDAASNTH